ncbi:MAG: heavy metal-associated domain-containing protein [Bacillota bacterium]|nr:heavy metal-associated domain-containing protein [Bacillota bacterium]
MTDFLIVCVLSIMMILGMRSAVKHFKGEGECCGGSSVVKAKRKRLKNIIRQRVIIIDGMTCINCKNRIEAALNNPDGVSARVKLNRKTAVVSMEKEVSDEQLRNIIENLGYRVIEIR